MKNNAFGSTLVLALLSGIGFEVHAGIFLNVQDSNLQPNQAGQSIRVVYSNDSAAAAVSGMTIALKIGGGDPPGGVEAPNFTGASAGASSGLG